MIVLGVRVAVRLAEMMVNLELDLEQASSWADALQWAVAHDTLDQFLAAK